GAADAAVEHVLRLVLRQERRQPAAEARALDLTRRVLRDRAAAGEEPEAAPDARELPRDARLGEPPLVERGQIGEAEARVRGRRRRALLAEEGLELPEVDRVVAQRVG